MHESGNEFGLTMWGAAPHFTRFPAMNFCYSRLSLPLRVAFLCVGRMRWHEMCVTIRCMWRGTVAITMPPFPPVPQPLSSSSYSFVSQTTFIAFTCTSGCSSIALDV